MADQGTVTTGKKSNGMKELLMISGVLVMVMFGVVVSFWVGSRPTQENVVATAVGAAPAEAQPKPMATPTPAPRAIVSAPTDLEVIHGDVYFDSNTARLRADAARVLQEKAMRMDPGSTWIVLAQGYADRYGTADYNRGLAQRRADEVKKFMVELGVPETSVKIAAIGQDGSVCDGPSRECQKLNRRVHLEIRKIADGAMMPAESAPAAITVR